MVERSRIIPIPRTEVSLWGSRNATSSNNDSEKDKADNRNDFDDAEDEFGFSVSFDAEEVDEDDYEPEDYDKGCWGDVFCPRPVGHCD